MKLSEDAINSGSENIKDGPGNPGHPLCSAFGGAYSRGTCAKR